MNYLKINILFIFLIQTVTIGCEPNNTDSKNDNIFTSPPGILSDLSIDSDDSSQNEPKPWAIAVVNSDFLSTSISIIDGTDKSMFADGIIDSGSTVPGLTLTLSGDIVLPRNPNIDNIIVLIDRYPNNVLTFISPKDFSVTKQMSVATGFSSNPHDYLWINEAKSYITRYESNPNSGQQNFDEGDDILIINQKELSVIKSINLTEYTDSSMEKMQAKPDQMVMGDKYVWVSLNHLSMDYKSAGYGLLAILNPETDMVEDVIKIPEMKNCTGIIYLKHLKHIYASCSGMFVNGIDEQLKYSGIVKIDTLKTPYNYTIVKNSKADNKSPYGFYLDIFNEKYLLSIQFGNLSKNETDKLVAINTENYSEIVIHKAETMQGIGGFLADNITKTIYIGETNPQNPRVFLYELKNNEFKMVKTIVSSPKSGLPPNYIRFY